MLSLACNIGLRLSGTTSRRLCRTMNQGLCYCWVTIRLVQYVHGGFSMFLCHYQIGTICSSTVPVSLSDWYNLCSSCCSCVTIRLVQYVLHAVPVSLSDWYNMFSVGSPCYCCVTICLVEYILDELSVLLLHHYQIGLICSRWVLRTTAWSLSNWSSIFSVGSPCHATIRLVQYVLGGFSELLL